VRAWVTGATGQIGRRLCNELALEGHDVIAFTRGRVENPSDYQWVHWDMSRDTFDFGKLTPPAVVFHLAAQTSAYKAREDLPGDVTTNVLGFVKLLEVLRQTESFPHVISAGAATEVGLTEGAVISDSDPDNPMTFYDVGKVSHRLYLKQCGSEGWLEGTTIRLPNVYGGLSENSSNDRGFVNMSIRRALLGEELRYYSDGEYIRDFLHVDDVVTALLSALNHRDAVANDTFVIGTGIGTRIRDVLAEIAGQAERITLRSVRLVPATPPLDMYDIERRNAIVDSVRFRERTGWESQVFLKEGVERTFMESVSII
jgi:nucleoside-diphosphate-sugar epimerase